MLTRRTFLQSLGATACAVTTSSLIPLGRERVPLTLPRALAQALPYDASGTYALREFDVVYRNDGDGEFLARVYQPEGAGPFPAMVSVHDGQWTRGDRTARGPIARGLATSGLVVFSPDFRNGSPETPHPAALVDLNYATRWFKAHAGEFNASSTLVGGLGASSGGHLVTLSAFRPRDPRYTSVPLTEAPAIDASLAYLVLVSPILDPYGRFIFAQETGRDDIVASTRTYFAPWDAVWEANPVAILERGEAVDRPPAIIVQGTADPT